MKKLICISIIAVLLMTSVSFAETIDVKSLSDDELAELNKTIQAELFSRHGVETERVARFPPAVRPATDGALSVGSFVSSGHSPSFLQIP